MRLCRSQGSIPETCKRRSGTLLHEPSWLLSHQFGQPDQVVRGATEDEQPVHFFQASQLDLAQRAGLLKPTEALLDQPSPAQADGIARLPCGSSVQVAAAALVVLRYMRCHVQLPHRADEILAVVSLVRAHRDAPRAALLLLLQASRARHRARPDHRRASPSRRQSIRCGSPPARGPGNSTSTPCRSSSCTAAHPRSVVDSCVLFVRFWP